MSARHFIFFALAIILVGSGRAGQAASPPVPDLTQGGKPDGTHDLNLGPTGARGWICGRSLATTDARQILVTLVEDGSRADGVLKAGDVILGVDGALFPSDARKALGAAITLAEEEGRAGALKLVRWRGGAVENVTVPLRVMGSYGDAAPRDCAKTAHIIDQACRHLAEHGLGDSIAAQVNALGLLATGRPEHLAQVRALAHQVGPPGLKLELESGMFAWTWGFSNLFLAEYFLATGDKYVLPAIKEYSTKIAMGQSSVGTWGHGMSLPEHAGGLGGYGAINQAGAGCWLSLILAQKCGVDEPVVREAIERSRRFYAFYVGKGSIPYGDHAPYYFLHDNNGKNGQVAIAFDLLGDQEATRFFSRMSTAAHAEREFGHTGNYFSYLWGPLGVARAGDAALAAHLKEQRWFYDLARSWGGGFTYQEAAGSSDSYKGWDATGVFLLTASAPLHRLYITGRGADPANALTGAALSSVIEAGRGFDAWHMDDCYITRKDADLLQALGSWSPTVRYRAAKALALKKSEAVPQLIAMLGSGDMNARYGACQALECMGTRAAPAVDALVEQLSGHDQWLQVRAAYALAEIGKPAQRAVPALLKLAQEGTPGDPRQTTRRYLGIALFLAGYVDTGPRRGLLADSVAGVDSELLLQVIRQMLATDDGLVRAQVASVYPKLSEAQLDGLWPDILRSVERGAPSGEMFADEIRVAGVRLLAEHRIEEGMLACLGYAKHQNPWASQDRMGELMKALVSYGAAAKPLLPELRALAKACRDEKDFPDDCKRKKTLAVEQAIAAIAASQSRPALRSIATTPPKEGSVRSSAVARPIKVFILAGQSNMEGQAVADLAGKDYNGGKGTLSAMVRDPATADRFKHLQDGKGGWAVRSDVWVRYKPEEGPVKAGPLTLGFTPHGGRHHFGPELQLGQVLGGCFEEPVLLIKTAWGGKSLCVDFRPPSSGGTVGPYYTRMLADIREALASVKQEFPAAGDRGCELAGLVWYQGWNDGCDPTKAVPEYEQNLVNLINDLRRDLGAPRLPVVVGELTGPWVDAPGEWGALRRAQAAAAARPEFRGTVLFVPTHDFVRKPEDSPNPGHGHHEFGNAETYFLVGDALGKAMKQLVPVVPGG